ncbi:MAG TPA: hypothetical protein VMI47_11310 [Pseudolabrys sp.]|nr:hypothetical protein [Pseudolabrys sp.]
MTLKEKALYNQIHPLKLSTDILAAAVSLYLFWLHQPLPALLLHFVPPLLASWLIIRYVDLTPQKDSGFGRYVAANMTRMIEGIRLFGDLVMIFGAWRNDPKLLALGFLVIVGAWCNGLLPSKTRRRKTNG